MRPASTKLWAVRTALVALFTAAIDNPGVVITSGPRTRGEIPKKFVLVGTDGGETGTGEGSIDTTTATQGRSAVSTANGRDENGRVVCGIWRWSGSPDDMPQLRTDVETMLDACAYAIVEDRTLGGVLDIGDDGAYLSGIRITEQQTQNGPLLRAAFDVTYDALLT